MKTRAALITVATLLSPMIFGAFITDTSRYPEGNAAYSGNIVGSFKGNYNNWLPLELQLGVDPSFSVQQQKLLMKATKIYMERALSKSVLACAFENSSRDLPSSRTDFEMKLSSALSPLNIGEIYMPSFAFIARYWGDAKSVALGHVGFFFDEDNAMPGYRHRHYLHIAINSDYLGGEANYPPAQDPEYWASVISHEFLHNLGFRHPQGYAGSFINEYAQCVRRNGADGAMPEGELPDIEVEKEL